MTTIGNNNMYTIQKNDTLWGITGGNKEKIDMICKANGIQDANFIKAGDKLDLSCLNGLGGSGNEPIGDEFTKKADDFDKFLKNGSSKSTFKMFDKGDMEQYANDMLKFSTAVNKKYDKNGDGFLDKDEIKAFGNKANIKNFDLDGDGKVSSAETAAFLESVDFDVAKYKKSGSNFGGAALDGKISKNDLQNRSNLSTGSTDYNYIRGAQQKFFDFFYKDEK